MRPTTAPATTAQITAPFPTNANASRSVQMLTCAWHMLVNGTFYQDPGPDYYTRHHPAKTKARAIKQLQALGYNVTLEPRTEAA